MQKKEKLFSEFQEGLSWVGLKFNPDDEMALTRGLPLKN